MAEVPVKLIVSLCVVFYAIFYRKGNLEDVRLSDVKENLLYLETQNKVASGIYQPKVALGYGACHDLFVNATSLLNPEELQGNPEHFNEISNMEEFLKSFTYFFKHGAAAE